MWNEGEKKRRGTMMMMMTVVCLLVCLHLTSQQDLAAGSNCEGERRNMCDVNSTCQVEFWSKTHYCRKKVGQPCGPRDPSYICQNDAKCSGGTCLLTYGANCTRHPHKCVPGYYCNLLNKCTRIAKGTCHRSTTGHCGVGSRCVERKCRCLTDRFTFRNNKCVPKKGVTGSGCQVEGDCQDPLGTCNTATGRCECVHKTVPHPRDLSCKLDAGERCNATSDCRPETMCDPSDNTCRLNPGKSCEGDRSGLCRNGTRCIQNLCRRKIGERCNMAYDFRECEPPAQCWYDVSRHIKVCHLKDDADCSRHPNDCYGSQGVCDPKRLVCKRSVNWFCNTNSTCTSGSVCTGGKCRCHPSEVYNSSTGQCSLPPGKVGGLCHEGNQCEDANADCNAEGVCECTLGYQPDFNLLTCNLKGSTCSLGGDGIIKTYFKQQLQVGLPCRIKLAKIQCDDAKVAVFADNGWESRTHSIYLSAVKIKILVTNSEGNSTSTQYRIVDDDIKQKPNSKAWKTKSSTAEDDLVTLWSDSKAGYSTLTRKLLKITYIHPNFGRHRITHDQRGHVLIQCGSDHFRSLNKHPEALCGRPEDAGQDVLGTYRRRVELQLKRELPNTFGYVPRGAFSTVRLTDRSVLLEQINVPQRNSQCQAAMNVVQSDAGCAILQDKLFNCSHVYDANANDRQSYAACLNVTDPMTLFASCMRLQCTGQGRTETCSSLRAAFTRCTSSVQTRLLRMFNCPLVVP